MSISEMIARDGFYSPLYLLRLIVDRRQHLLEPLLLRIKFLDNPLEKPPYTKKRDTAEQNKYQHPIWQML